MNHYGNSGANTGGTGGTTKTADPMTPYVRPGGVTVTIR